MRTRNKSGNRAVDEYADSYKNDREVSNVTIYVMRQLKNLISNEESIRGIVLNLSFQMSWLRVAVITTKRLFQKGFRSTSIIAAIFFVFLFKNLNNKLNI